MATTAPAPAGLLRPDEGALRQFWQTYVAPGDIHEVRILHTRPGRARLAGTAAGYFTDAEPFARVLARITGLDAAGVYMTMNPVTPGVLARGFGQDAGASAEVNRLQSRVKTTASDADILHRRYLLVDLDPVREPKDISATDEEMHWALLRRDDVRRYLREEQGWPEPLVCSWSGNGGALLYRIDLPNDAPSSSLVQRVLAALDHHWSDAQVRLDCANYNAARLTKVIGSVAAKGLDFAGYAHEPARPWRLTRATYSADARAVTRDQLERLAGEAPVASPAPAGATVGMPVRTWTMADLLRANNLHARADAWTGGGTKYRLERCLTSGDHTDGAALIEMPSGAIVYKCHHERCSGKGWRYVREHNILALPGVAGRNGHGSTADRLGHAGQQQQRRASEERGPGGNQQDGSGAAGPRRQQHEEQRKEQRKEQQGEQEQRRTGAVVHCMADVEPEDLEWKWHGRIALGKLTLVIGDPGLGKSMMMLNIAARSSKGQELPADPRVQDPSTTLLLSAEDDPHDTIRPHLNAQGADARRVFLFEAVRELTDEGERERLPNLERDLTLLDEQISAKQAALVIIDPINAYLGEIKGNTDTELRRVFTPLSLLARRHKCAIVGVTHLNKAQQPNALYRALGSIAYVAAARSVLAVARDPQDESRRIVVQIKNNLAALADGLGFTIEKPYGYVKWDDQPVNATAETVFAVPGSGEQQEQQEQATAHTAAERFLLDILAKSPGNKRPAKEVHAEARELRIAARTLERARETLGVDSQRVGFGPGSIVWWTLPEDVQKSRQTTAQRPAADAPSEGDTRHSRHTPHTFHTFQDTEEGAEYGADHTPAIGTSHHEYDAYGEYGDNGVCGACGGTRFWELPEDAGGGKRCALCHPQPATDDMTESMI